MESQREKSYGERCREMADDGYPTGWRCADCAVLWWPMNEAHAAAEHARENEHTIFIGSAPFQAFA